MPNYFNPQQQQPPGLFSFIDILEQYVHGVVPYVLAGCMAVGGYFVGINQDVVPVVVPVAVGGVIGLLLVPLLLKLLSGLLAAIIVIAAALLCFWLLSNDSAMKHHQQPPPRQSAPASPAYGEATRQLLHRALQEVQHD